MTEETRGDGPNGSVGEKGSEPGQGASDAAFPEAPPHAPPPGEVGEQAAATLPAADDEVAAEGVENRGPLLAAAEQEAILIDAPVEAGRDKNEGDSADPGAAPAAAKESAGPPSDVRVESDAPAPAADEPGAGVEAAGPQSPATADDPPDRPGSGNAPELDDSAHTHGSFIEQRPHTETPPAAAEPAAADQVSQEEPGSPDVGNEPRIDHAPASGGPDERSPPTAETQVEEHADADRAAAPAGEQPSSHHPKEAFASRAAADPPAEPIPGELIWSRPEEAESPVERAADAISPTEASSTDASSSTGVAIWQSGEPPVAEAAVLSAAPAIVATAATARPAESAPQVQPALGRRRLGGYVRLVVGFVAALVLGYTALVLVLSVLYRWVDPPASALMVAQQLSGTRIEQRWVPLRRISPHLVQAVILSEDGAFCRHRGVDWSAMGEAIESAREGVVRGGSTITMQVVKNLFLWSWRSYVRKAIEIPLAYLVDFLWPKARVLEIYLNIAEWGDGIFGAEAAARHYFRKPAANLTAQEAALLAAALPNPLERDPGQPGYLVRRLASNLQARMKTVRTTMGCVRPFAPTR